MALLAMNDTRIGSILTEMFQVVRHRISRGGECEHAILDRCGEAGRLSMAMAALLTRQMPMVMKGR